MYLTRSLLSMRLSDILHHDLFENKKSVYYVFLVRQILFLASRGFIDKVFYCQITDKGLQNHYGDTIVIESQKNVLSIF
jgi:hypothetical protein